MKEKAKKIRYETISIKKDITEKVNTYMEQISEHSAEIKVSRGGLINYLIGKMPKQLDRKQLLEIEDLFYDVEGALYNALKKVREAKKQGDMIKLSDALPEKQKRTSSRKNNTKNTKTNVQNRADKEEAIGSEIHLGGAFKESSVHENSNE